jgi:hypothetical protein
MEAIASDIFQKLGMVSDSNTAITEDVNCFIVRVR